MTPFRFMARAALAAWLLGGAGCSLALATDAEQCNVDSDCTSRGPAFANTVCSANVCAPPPDPKWGCVGSVPSLVAGGMTSFTLQLQNLVTMVPITSDLTIQLCSKLDPTCAAHLTTSPLSVDAKGNVSVTVASDFDGYLDITDASGTYVEALVFIDVVAEAENTLTYLVPKNAEMGLAANAMVPLDPTGSLLLVQTVDCTGKRTAGASVSMAPVGSETAFYVIGNSLLPTATATDVSGNAGFVNVMAPQTVTLTGTIGPGGKEYGKVTTLVRSGTVTYQILRPTTPP
jgi:hypothetical protein